MSGNRTGMFLFCGLVCLALTGCDGGDVGRGTVDLMPVSALTGSWYGTVEDAINNPHVFQVVLATDGSSTAELLDGLPTGVTHTVATVPGYPQVFSLEGSDGSSGGFYVDGSATYALLVDDNRTVGMLQKGATGLPTYSDTDVWGSWLGYEVQLDGNYDFMTAYNSVFMVLTNYLFLGINRDGDIGGTVDSYFPGYGLFRGTQLLPGFGSLVMILSPDKTYAGGYTCPNAGSRPGACYFYSWKKE